jgi:hypothetical protein
MTQIPMSTVGVLCATVAVLLPTPDSYASITLV